LLRLSVKAESGYRDGCRFTEVGARKGNGMHKAKATTRMRCAEEAP
jgi:hypothetical protein